MEIGQKKILILGGIFHMIDVVKTARKMGFYTIVTDNVDDSPAKSYADKAYNISTADIDAVMAMAKAENVSGIFTAFEDINTWHAQILCEKLNLPFYATKEQLEITSNKDQFKAFCKKFEVPVIDEYELTSDGIEQAASNMKFPVIIKPVDSYASKGITVCYSAEEVKIGYEKALSFSKSKNVIIEPFIDNSYGVQLFYTVQNGRIILSGVVDRYVYKQGRETPPLPIAMVFPSQHQKHFIENVDSKIRNMIHGMGIQNGMVFIQSLYEAGDYYIYEMGFRFSGEQHYKIIEKQTGINLLEMMLDFAVGNPIEKYDIANFDNAYTPFPSCNLPILLSKGTIKEIIGLEKVEAMAEVISDVITHQAGDTIEVIGAYSQMLGRFNIVAQTIETLCQTINAIQDTLHVISADGEEMIIKSYHPAAANMHS
jgi:biotin carboxylase